jgi:hypothetical protein
VIKATIKIEILSYWHAGTGHGQGAAYDALTRKDSHNLPYLPGRTVKGLLREGLQIAEDFGEVAEASVAKLFGRPAREGEPDGSEPGVLSFSNACLPEDLCAWARSTQGTAETLYRPLASTELDASGQARDKSLRCVEVCVPVTLAATVSGPDDTSWIEVLKQGARFMRGLGSHRSRGLGRCVVTISREGSK